MNREYHHWYSKPLGREMELLVFGYGGRPVLFFPTRMARFYDYENFGVIDALADKITRGELQVFCVDSIDSESFYNESTTPQERINRHLLYEQYILTEVSLLISIKNPNKYIEVAGCSMGAYHAANIAFRHPHLFSKLVCMSGRYDLTRQIQQFRDLFDGYHNEDIYFNTPRQFMTNMEDAELLDNIRQMEIIFAIGDTDPFKQDNIEFSHLLNNKGISHRLNIWTGFAHNARNWKKMVQIYF